MSSLRRFWNLRRRARIDDELRLELATHLQMLEDEERAQGFSAEHAERRAKARFGNSLAYRERSLDAVTARWLEDAWKDVRFATRQLRKSPGFTAAVVVVLGAVIGLHTTLVTVVAGVLLRPWPGVREASRVVRIYLWDANGGPQPDGLSLMDARTLAAQARSLAGVATITSTELTIGSGDTAESAAAQMVSGNFFELLGVAMAQGHGFVADDDRLGAPRAVAVLGFDFWQSRFAGDPGIVGRELQLNDVPFTVVGVASHEFATAEPSFGRKLFVPISSLSLLRRRDPSVTNLLYKPSVCCSEVVGRLTPGWSRAQARAEIDVLSRSFERRADGTPRAITVTNTAFFSPPGRSSGASGPLAAIALVSAGMGLVWLIACANIGNLLLARSAARAREIGIRISLGASRLRLVRQLLTEGCVLALAASAVGTAVAYRLPFVILHLAGGASASFPFRVDVDAFVVGYALLIATASSLAFALAPSLHATKADVVTALNDRDALTVSRFPLRAVLLGVQVAVSVVLLVSAVQLVRGVQRQAGSFDPGFAVDDVSAVSFDLPVGAYDDARRRAILGDLTSALQALPPGTVDALGFGTWEPTFIRRGLPALVRLPGQSADDARTIIYLQTTSGYLDALRIPIIAGRNFEPADTARPVAIINEAMARKYWPDARPLGQTFVIGRDDVREVVGVMRNAHTQSMSDEIAPLFYEPLKDVRPFPTLLLRTRGHGVAMEMTSLVARIDPRIRVRTTGLASHLEDRLRESRTAPLVALTLGGFALALATIGMFGVFAYAVRQRTREIGVRMALGAQPSAIVRLVVGGHTRAVIVGLAAGAFGALAASMVLRSRLHGVSPFDPIAYLEVAAILAAAGLAASYLPARHAVRVDPVIALRCE
jgi:predicted permease